MEKVEPVNQKPVHGAKRPETFGWVPDQSTQSLLSGQRGECVRIKAID
jgi:hypothetical protein